MNDLDTSNCMVTIRLGPFLERVATELGTRLAHLATDDDTETFLADAVGEALLAGLLSAQLGTGTTSNTEITA